MVAPSHFGALLVPVLESWAMEDLSIPELAVGFLIPGLFILLTVYGIRFFVRSVQEKERTIGAALMICAGIAGFVFVEMWVLAAMLTTHH